MDYLTRSRRFRVHDRTDRSASRVPVESTSGPDRHVWRRSQAARGAHVLPLQPELGTVDVGGHHVATTKKFRDVQANGWAALVVDDLVSTDPWTPRMLEIRGRAEPVATGGSTLGPGFGEAFIRIHPEKVNSFGID